MSASKKRAARIVPRLFRQEGAADYCGVSLPTFLEYVKKGLFSPPKAVGSIKAFDRTILDRDIDALPFVGAAVPDTTWTD
jgi:hypothetical protein